MARSVISMPRVKQEDLGALGVPAHWLLVSAAVLDGSRMLLEWVVPPGVDPGPMRDWVLDRGGEAWLGWKLPVQTCSPSSDVDTLGRRLRLLLAKLRLRTPLVAYMLLAVLDRLRLVRLCDAVRLTAVALARDPEPLAPTATLRRSLVRRYYVELSRAQVLGRYRVLGPRELAGARAYLLVEPGCAEQLYGVAAAHGAASHVFHGGVAAASLLLDNSVQRELAGRLGGCIVGAGLRLRSLYSAFPYELYNPLEGRWRLEPVPGFMERLARAGLLERRKNAAGG